MDDTDEIIERLCVIAGMIMEDGADAALGASASAGIDDRLALLNQTGRDIEAIAAAARVISRRYGA